MKSTLGYAPTKTREAEEFAKVQAKWHAVLWAVAEEIEVSGAPIALRLSNPGWGQNVLIVTTKGLEVDTLLRFEIKMQGRYNGARYIVEIKGPVKSKWSLTMTDWVRRSWIVLDDLTPSKMLAKIRTLSATIATEIAEINAIVATRERAKNAHEIALGFPLMSPLMHVRPQTSEPPKYVIEGIKGALSLNAVKAIRKIVEDEVMTINPARADLSHL